MPRTVFALIVVLCSLSPALATLSPRTAPLPADSKLAASLATPLPQDKPLSRDVLQAAASERDDDYRITSTTTVFLDGRPCCYADVPHNAGVVKMEVSSDDHTVVSIHFRSKK